MTMDRQTAVWVSRDPAQTVILMNFGSCFFPHGIIPLLLSFAFPSLIFGFDFLSPFPSFTISSFDRWMILEPSGLYGYHSSSISGVLRVRTSEMYSTRLHRKGSFASMENSPSPLRQSLHDRGRRSLLSIDQC